MKWTQQEVLLLRSRYDAAQCGADIRLTELAAELGRLRSNVCRKARSLGLTDHQRKKVERRADAPKYASEAERRAAIGAATKARIAENGHPRGATGMKHTSQTRAVLSEKSKAVWAVMSEEQRMALTVKRIRAKRATGKPIPNVRGTWKAGWREIGDRSIFFRSRWEANYARYLEWLRMAGEIQDWQHEAHTFWFEGVRRGCVSYLPDFKVTENGGAIRWHEVKGWMDARSKTVLDRMAKYHPNEVIVLVREKQYEEIRRKASPFIGGWE